MKNATKKLLADRGDVARFVAVQRRVEPEAKVRLCIENCISYTRKNLDAMAVFGWCIGDFVAGRGTALIPHCWVRDGSGIHIDITPLPNNARDHFEYISDDGVFDLFLYHNVWPLPLRLTPTHTYQIRVAPDHYVDIPNVSFSTLLNNAAQHMELL